MDDTVHTEKLGYLTVSAPVTGVSAEWQSGIELVIVTTYDRHRPSLGLHLSPETARCLAAGLLAAVEASGRELSSEDCVGQASDLDVIEKPDGGYER